MLTRRAAVEAAAALAASDAVMAGLVAEHGPPRLVDLPRRRGMSRFEELAQAICYQQLAGKAAESIWRRVRALTDGAFTPESVLALSIDQLRAAGLSGAKTASILDLAQRADEGSVRLARIGRLPDDEVVAELVQVRGIGVWTAQMFLMFSLGRPDVWPVLDFGVRAGYARAYGLGAPPTAKELEAIGERFRPYRSAAAWYCWRAVETLTPSI